MRRSSPLWELYKTRIREFWRQPARIFWVYGFPTVLAIVLGAAFKSRPPDAVVFDVVEASSTQKVREWIDAHNKTPRRPDQPALEPRFFPHDEAIHRLKTGRTALVVEPTGSDSVAIVYHFDPTRPEAVTTRAVVDDALQRVNRRVEPVSVREVLIEERGSRYIDFLIPGLIGLNTMGGGLWGVGFLIVNFRRDKLLKRFRATPMPRRDFLLAVLGARLTFLLPDLIVLMSVGVFMFGMPVRGSLPLVVLIDVIGALAFAGIGLLVASRARTTEAISGLMNLVMIPMWLFSGVFFASDRFPAEMQPFIQALPLTQLLNAMRSVILEGAGLVDVAWSLVILTVWTIVTFLLALRVFRWT